MTIGTLDPDDQPPVGDALVFTPSNTAQTRQEAREAGMVLLRYIKSCEPKLKPGNVRQMEWAEKSLNTVAMFLDILSEG